MRREMPRINKRPAGDPAAPAAEAPQSPTRNNTFTDQTVLEAWKAFADAHPSDTILVNTMRACLPQRSAGTAFTITVENPMQVDELTRVMPQLLQALRRAADNDTLTLSTTINPGPGSRSTWNDREVVNEMAAKNPVLKKMIEDFNLRLD